MISYRATLDVSRELARHVAGLLRAERCQRGTPTGTRKLSCFWQAVVGLRWFRDRTSPDRLACDHGMSRATAYRYLDEGIDVLAEQAPDLQQALQQAREQQLAYIILDGTVITADRLTEKTTSVQGKSIDLWYSGKAHCHGGNIQALSAPSGQPLWVGDVEPGSVHDLTAAREHVLPAVYAAAAQGLPTLADAGYDGAGIGVHTPIKQPAGNQVLDVDTRTRNALLRGLRSIGERGFALLTGRWRTLRRITASPQNRRHRPSSPRTHPIRTDHMKVDEITSLRISVLRDSRHYACHAVASNRVVPVVAGSSFQLALLRIRGRWDPAHTVPSHPIQYPFTRFQRRSTADDIGVGL